MASYQLAELATLLNAECRGDADCLITGVATIDTATAGQITFLAQPRYRQHLTETRASAVILSPKDADACPTHALVMANPYWGYAKVAALFEYAPHSVEGVHPSAVVAHDATIHPTARVGEQCVIGKGAVIGENVVLHPGCIIGDHVEIGAFTCVYPRVTLYHHVCVGERVIIHSGAVVGSDGFGFANEKGVWHKIAQLGRVIIGNDVEIGANTTIDRGALGDTVIGNGVKLDNQIQIAHNVHIGDHTAIAACVGIAGSTHIGRHCMIGGAACVGGHLTIADGTVITGMAMITKSIEQRGMYSSGTGFQENRAWQKSAVRFRQLDELFDRVAHLEKLSRES